MKSKFLNCFHLFICIISFLSVSIVKGQIPVLWGTANFGGLYDKGSIFRVNGDGSNFSTVFSFDSINGSIPKSSLCAANNGILYGMTQFGGVNNVGILFSYNPSTNTFTKILDFDNINGGFAWGTMIQASNNMLYGATYGGGLGGGGVIFELNPVTNNYSLLYALNHSTDGGSITDKLTETSNGKLYGLCAYGGANNKGTIISINPGTASFTKIHDFNGVEGAKPYGSLLEATDGNLYGFTYEGGANNKGVLFKVNLSSGLYTKILDLNGLNGNNPWNSLTQISSGKLVGLVSSISGGGGAIVDYDLLNTNYSIVHTFNIISEGFIPWGSLLKASDNQLYATLSSGPLSNTGSIFRYDYNSNTFHNVHSFIQSEGSNLNGHLVESGTVSAVNDFTLNAYHVYPIPCKDNLTIELQSQNSSYQFTFSDLSGKVLIHGENIGTSNTMDVSNIKAGYYLLSIDHGESSYTCRVIKL